MPGALWALALLCAAPSAHAQRSAGSTAPPQIREIRFEGDSTIGDGELRNVIRSKESAGGVARFFYRLTGGHIGAPAEFYEPEQFEEDKR